MLKRKNINNFYLSFLILVFFSLFLSPSSKFVYFEWNNIFSVNKIFFNFYIYLSIFFLPYSFLDKFDDYFEKKLKIIFYILIFYSFFQIIPDIIKTSKYTSIFGNPYFGPMFFVPIYLLWGTQLNAIYWFNRISLISIKIGLFLIPISIIFSIPLPTTAFLPSYYLLSIFDYVNTKKKLLIILGIIAGLICFYLSGYRSGVTMIILSILIFFTNRLNNKKFNKFVLYIFFIIPVLIFLNQISNNQNIFSVIANLFSTDTLWSVDTRSFMTKEVILDLNSNNKILFGKGSLGTYYSNFFDNMQHYLPYKFQGEQSLRYQIEIGFLHYLVKAGLFYIFLIFLITFMISVKCLSHSKNNLLRYLSLYIGVYFMFSIIENPPIFNLKHISMWIILAICGSKIFINLDDSKIKTLILEKN